MQPSVHYLPEFNQIVYVAATEGLKAAFVFSEPNPPYFTRQRMVMDRDPFCMHTMIAPDRRSVKKSTYFIAAMFDASPTTMPIMLFKFMKDEEKSTDTSTVW